MGYTIINRAVSIGINKAKLITVYKPEDGGIAHATVGFAGLYGALAGMSAEGITGTVDTTTTQMPE